MVVFFVLLKVVVFLARSRLDRHRALDGMALQIKSRVLCAVDGIIAGHVGQQREFCAAVSVCVKGCLQISESPPQAAALAIVRVLVATAGAPQ